MTVYPGQTIVIDYEQESMRPVHQRVLYPFVDRAVLRGAALYDLSDHVHLGFTPEWESDRAGR